MWDQTKEGNPPQGFFFGTEYTKEDINKAISENDATLSTDETGTGTMLSGICAGLGNVNSQYEGVAKDSELIIIKLKKIGGNYNNVYYYLARDYATQISQRLQRAIVINTSLGSNQYSGFINLSQDLNNWFNYSYAEVAGIGNQGNTETHKNGKIETKNEEDIVEIEIEKTEPNLIIELWVARPDKIQVKIISPTGEESEGISVGYYEQISGTFNFENTDYLITYIFPTTFSGQEFVVIYLYNATPGIWKLKLTGVEINSGIYNLYLPNRELINDDTRFVESNPSYTINYPAVTKSIFTVGAYDTINDVVWPPSSRGPNIRDDQKPQIIAPGVNIIAPYPNGRYGTITGTGAAAALTSGVAALFFEYVLKRNKYKRQGFSQSIYSFFQIGAERKDDINYPNNIYGYGMLDAKGIFESFR